MAEINRNNNNNNNNNINLNNNNNNNAAEGARAPRPFPRFGFRFRFLIRPNFSSFSNHRLFSFGLFSLGICLAIISNAWHQNHHFYTMGIHLSRSGASMMALMNMFLFLTLVFGRVLQKAVFGPLRRVEVDHLYERSWLTITEMLLAMTIFRDEFDTKLTFFFTLLLFLKAFHWISSDRVDYMEHTTNTTFRTHLRLQSFMYLLLGMDLYLIWYTAQTILKQGRSVMILFGFEFVILAFSMLVILIKYAMNLYDARRGHLWENKTMWMFYLDLVHDFFKLTSYLAFFIVIMHFYGLPLHIIRDLYLTLRSFILKVRDLMSYRRATRNMDTRYPDVLGPELDRLSDRTCIICREDMVGKDEQLNLARRYLPKKLPCQHVFHFGCLRTWLERQQSCPTCRRPVLETTPEPQPTPPAQPNLNPNPNPNPNAQVNPTVVAPPTQPHAPPTSTSSSTPLPTSSSSSSSSTSSFASPSTTPVNHALQASLATWLSQLPPPLPPPPPPPPMMMFSLTPEQLSMLNDLHSDRAHLEEKLRLLSHVQAHLTAAMTSLTQLLSSMPLTNPSTSSSSTTLSNPPLPSSSSSSTPSSSSSSSSSSN